MELNDKKIDTNRVKPLDEETCSNNYNSHQEQDNKLIAKERRRKQKQRFRSGCSSLMYACQQGHTGTIVKELRNKPTSIYKRDKSNKSALHYCSGQRNLVAAASVAVAAPELLESADEDGFTPLHLAVIQGNMALVNLLLANKADVNALDNEGHSVVHWATVCGEVDALRSVLMAGADVSAPDVNGGSPLHYAAQMCGANYDGKTGQQSQKLALEILNIFLNHPKAEVDVIDKDGRQPLLWAASAGSAKAVLALIKAGARVESSDKDGLTAIHCAASRGHTDCIDTLISLCGAPTDLIDSNGCTALHYAVTLGHADATSLLLDLEADPNRQDRKGRTPAHCGCAKGQFETVKLLRERRANMWLRNAKGDLPIHEAASSGRRELVQWLLEQKPKQVNITSNDGRTILHIAAGNDNTDMCKMLLDFGADVNSIYRTTRNVVMTPLDCALQKGLRSTAKFLQLHGGLPASKLRLSGRKPNAINDQELVTPLNFSSNNEGSNLKCADDAKNDSKHFVVYVNKGTRRDSDSCDDNVPSKSHHKSRIKCHHHHHHVHHRHKHRLRTSSCETYARQKDDNSSGAEMNRSKSNIEIHRRRKSRHKRDSTSSASDDSSSSSSECCRHRRKEKHHKYKRKDRSTSRKSAKQEQYESTDKENSDGACKKRKRKEKRSKRNETSTEENEVANKGDTKSSETTKDEEKKDEKETEKNDLLNDNVSEQKEVVVETKVEMVKTENAQTTRPASAASLKRPQSAKSTQKKSKKNMKKSVEKNEPNADEKPIEPIVESQRFDVSDDGETTKTILIKADVHSPNIEDCPETPQNADALNVEDVPVTEQTSMVIEVTKENADDIKQNEVVQESTVVNESHADGNLSDSTFTVENKGKVSKEESSVNVENTAQISQEDKKTAEEKETVAQEALFDGTKEEVVDENLEASKTIEDKSFAIIADELKPSALDTDDQPRKSSFTVLASDESIDHGDPFAEIITKTERSKSFQVLNSIDKIDESNDEDEYVSSEGDENLVNNYDNDEFEEHIVRSASDRNGRRKRLKKRIRTNVKQYSVDVPDNKLLESNQQQLSKDQDSGFEPSPRAMRTKIPSPRIVYTAVTPRKSAMADGRTSSRLDGRKPGDKNAVNMATVTQSIQRNIKRYYMERKIFQHLLELKSLQIRSSKVNESVLVKRAVDDYHKSTLALGGMVETAGGGGGIVGGGGSLRRYPYKEYTFKNFEIFLYETLKSLQKTGTYNFQNISDVYKEAERRLSPDYNRYEKALQCTTKTHRCLHAAHAYTGIPCAAYIPMMNHHTMPKYGFGSMRNTGVGSFYLPKILTKNSGGSGVGNQGKVSLELSHGNNKQLISLPSEKLDSNKRYYVTFTVKGTTSAENADTSATREPASKEK